MKPIMHYCPDCLLGAVGEVSQQSLLKMANEANLDEEHFWLLLTAAEMGFEFGQETAKQYAE